MERLVLALGGLLVAVVVALVARRRSPRAVSVHEPAGPGGYPVPATVTRDDFPQPDAPWLVAVFTSATCDSCRRTVTAAEQLAGGPVAVAEVEVGARADLHDRYGIEAVPLIVVADADGVVRASFVGPPTATDLWGTVAELREPGSLPPACDHGQDRAAPP